MRTIEEHLDELANLHANLERFMDLMRRTRTNLPLDSYTRRALLRHESSLAQIKNDLWFMRESLAQNGYGQIEPLPSVETLNRFSVASVSSCSTQKSP